MHFTTLIFLSALLSSALAKKSDVTGKYVVTINGVTYNPVTGKDVKGGNIVATSDILVKGTHNSWTINYKTLGAVNYTLTGYPDTLRSYPTGLLQSPQIIKLNRYGHLSNHLVRVQSRLA